MFKDDGSEIGNPRAYVASIEKNGYTRPLFTADGAEIKNPKAFLAKLDLPRDSEKASPRGVSRKAEAPTPTDGAIMFKADGTPIKNPERYVASIEKNGYTDPLFTARGTE